MRYREYLRSDEWKELRKQVIERALKNAGSTNIYGICEVCGCEPNRHCLQVHHKEYPEELGTESIDSLLLVCGRCHAQIHKDDKKYIEKHSMKVRKKEMQKIEYWIKEKIGVLVDNDKNVKKELNVISWNNAEAVIDLRGWFSDEKGNRKPLKGITLTVEEAKALSILLSDFFSKDEPKVDEPTEEVVERKASTLDGFKPV